MLCELKESKAHKEAHEEESRACKEAMFHELNENKAREEAMFDKIERMMDKI